MHNLDSDQLHFSYVFSINKTSKTNIFVFFLALDHDNEASSSNKKKAKTKQLKKSRYVRMAGGTTWEDETLAEWDSGKKLELLIF